MGPHRNIEVIRGNSDEAVALCYKLLEPAADFFAGERFALSGLAYVTRELTLGHDDGMDTYLAFTARKMEEPEDLDEGEESMVEYHLTLAVSRPYERGMYWPGLNGEELCPSDEVLVPVFDDRQESDSDTIGTGVDLEDCYVTEVYNFFIDDLCKRPRVELTTEYYDAEDDEEPLAVVQAHSDEVLANTVLSEDAEEDALLRAMDQNLNEGFSRFEVEAIVNILKRLGFISDFLSVTPEPEAGQDLG